MEIKITLQHILPDIFPRILIAIDDFPTWCRVRYINKWYYEFIRAHDYKKLLEFTRHMKTLCCGVYECVNILPNSVKHGSHSRHELFGAFHYRKQYKCTFNCGIKCGYDYTYDVKTCKIYKINEFTEGEPTITWEFTNNSLTYMKLACSNAFGNVILRIDDKTQLSSMVIESIGDNDSIDRYHEVFDGMGHISKVIRRRDTLLHGLSTLYNFPVPGYHTEKLFDYGHMLWVKKYDISGKLISFEKFY